MCILLFFIYVRLTFKFWSMQPVFHVYDFYYWFVNVGIIRKELPSKNRYVNFNKIKTKCFENISELTQKQIITLIRLNYYRNKENKYDPHTKNVIPYFAGHNAPTFWSYYLEPVLYIDNKTSKTIEDRQIVGVITSRPLHVIIFNNNKSIFDVYYVDYLCVNKNWRKKNIAPQLIQTHEYNQSHNNRKICVSLFKREEELTGIIPLTIYKTYCFPIRQHMFDQLEASVTILTGDKQNMYYLYEFLTTLNNEVKHWEILIYPEISNIMELVATKNLFIKMLVIDGNIEAIYIFRKTCTFIKKGREILSCIASIRKRKGVLSKEDFVRGFKASLWSIIKDNNNFKYLTIEDISDNECIINDICLKSHPNIISPMAYFFYNFAYSPFKSGKCIIIN